MSRGDEGVTGLCRVGHHAPAPVGEDPVCPRCGRLVVRWTDAPPDAVAAPPRPADLRWSEADGGSFIAFSYASRPRVGSLSFAMGRLVITSAMIFTMAGFLLVGDPRWLGRVLALALIALGVRAVYAGLADAFTQTVVRLDPRALDVRRAPRLLPGESLELSEVERFAWSSRIVKGGDAPDEVQFFVHASQRDLEDVELKRLPVRSAAQAAYVAHRLSDALVRLRVRALGAGPYRASDDAGGAFRSDAGPAGAEAPASPRTSLRR